MSGLHSNLSDFGQQLARERERLLSRLVERLSGVQDDDCHAGLLQSCLMAVQHHSFPDPAPRVVEEQYVRLSDRMGEYAQFGKQRALQLLRSQLLGLPIETTQYEFQHRLLAFLYCASRSPLSTQFASGPLVEKLEEQARAAVVGPPTYLSDDSSDSWADELGAFSTGSQLSDWSHLSDADLDGQEAAAEQEAGLAEGSATGAGEGKPEPRQQGEQQGAASTAQRPTDAAAELAAMLARYGPPAAAAAAQAAWQPQREAPYNRTSLSVWLASKRSGGQPSQLLDPRLCFHENELVQQVIHMLKGVSCPGGAFQLDPVRDAYTPRPGVHQHSTSHGSARSLLERFAADATAVRRVQAFCAQVACAGGHGGSSSSGGGDEAQQLQEEQRLYALPTMGAFAAAVAEQERGLQQQVLLLEAAAASGTVLTLLQLRQRTAALAEQAALLAALIRRCCCWRGSPAETAAGLLSGLHDAVQLRMLQARSQGGVLAAMLLRVFTASCRPMLTTLHKWLFRGQLDDPAAEFFVQASGTGIPTDSPRFWPDAYTLRTSAASGGTPAAPCFLLPLAGSILAAGKSALLLQAYSSWRLAAAAARRAGGGGGLLASGPPRDAGPESPSKRRLSEYGALGFAIAAEGQQQLQRYGVPAAAAPLDDSLALLGEDAPGPEPPLLHQQMLAGLQEQLCPPADGSPAKAWLQHSQPAVPQLAAAGNGGSDSDDGSSSHACAEEKQQGCVACSGHALQLPPADTLPPLPRLPASIEALPAAKLAVIAPAGAAGFLTSACGSGAAPGALCTGSSGRLGGLSSVADRMRAAAAARVVQAACSAAEQLPLLLVAPAPLEAGLAGAGAAGGSAPLTAAEGPAAAAAGQQGSAPAAPGGGAEAAGHFDGTAWQQWYLGVASALSRQLQLVDGSKAGATGSSGGGSSEQRLSGAYGVPLCLAPYSGRPMDQVWGRSGGGGSALAHGLGGSTSDEHLEPAAVAEAPPLDLLLQHSLLKPVRAQVDAASGALCAALLRHGLLRQLAALRDTYLLGSPLLEPFVGFLLRRISTTAGGMDRLSEFELDAALQDTLAAGGKAHLLHISAHILPPPPGQGHTPGVGPATARLGAPVAGGVLPRMQQLGRLRLRVEPGWPLSLVVGEDMLAQYNAVLVLLLQLRWAKQSLQSVRYQGWKARKRGSKGVDALQHQMVHLVESVLQYINNRVVAAGTWLEQAIQSCASLDEMHRCRAKYLRAVTRYCLLSSEGVARLVHEGLLHLLNACLQYCSLRQQAAAAAAALQALDRQAAAGGSAAEDDGEEAGGGQAAQAAAAGPAGLHLAAARRAELHRRAADAAAALDALRREYANRQRLLLRVLATKAAEAGSHADELRQLLGVLDFSRFYEAAMA